MSLGIAVILVTILICRFAFTEEVKKTKEEELINSKIYLVQPRDTLWGIAQKFYTNPFEWRKIHLANPGVKNPDLIYPGERLIIPFLTGQVEVVTPSEKVAPAEVVTPVEKIAPVLEIKDEKSRRDLVSLREEKKIEISTAVVEVNVPESTEKKEEIIISRDKYLKMKFSPENFVVPENWQFDGLITGEKEKKILISAEDTVYLNIGSGKGLKPGMYCFVVRKEKKSYLPEAGKLLGRNIQRIGIAEIIEVKENNSSARIITSSEAIEVGDGIKIEFDK